MNKLTISRLVMISAIAVIVAFQCYWINLIFQEEKERTLKQTDLLFKELVYTMQVNRFKADTLFLNAGKGNNLFALEAANALLKERDSIKPNIFRDSVFVNTMTGVLRDSSIKKTSITQNQQTDSKKISLFLDTLLPKPSSIVSIRVHPNKPTVAIRTNDSLTNIRQWLHKKNRDSIGVKPIMSDSFLLHQSINLTKKPSKEDKKPQLIRISKSVSDITTNRSIISLFSRSIAVSDSLSIKDLDSAYAANLNKSGIDLTFTIKTGLFDSLHLKDTVPSIFYKTSIATVGFTQPKWFQAKFNNPTPFLLLQILPQAFLSLLLIAFISIAFIFLYRNLLAQQKLAIFKNEFISNITHELKTPIATVNVAIEALRNFNALQNPDRTKEYLEISSAEIQRLSLLVDKVLKLSMFESDKIVLNKEWFNLKQLLEDILDSIKIQFDQKNALIEFNSSLREVFINADKLHISSVIYNLLDNALKYSGKNTVVKIHLTMLSDNFVELRINDNGIGIAKQFQDKIFDKFFRVPTGDVHNIKGYGLGLSYVNHIIRQHNGSISVQSELGKGSEFVVQLPVSTTENKPININPS
ncbi:cell wall metabolism sensor histidine kinase WalK [Sediminibacterium sp.]|uniref:sensor histidine kinase n=1 Tax=Sediminibacterium sp. TaxID=1917865 RepID=UPI002735689E|nr:HAMP domain-containing sensor histidine kinase [Sediminibacterium sp.]MDP3393423.1 HAMP domain-containing sensor histidine kinase [Sediminibacterium sp.]MDP3568025.1 HAMP domain-containing sensor histidine kinase [Sediminibacterium sp.]